MATSLSKLNMHPHFEAVHYILMCMLFRKDDCGNLAPSFCRKHIVASWFGSMILCFSGSIVSNLLIGEVLIIPFKYHENIILASVIWFLVNYSPIGMTLKVLNLTFIRLILNTFWCLFIVNKVQSGVMYGVKHYPGAYFIIVALGVSKGAGHLFMNAVLKAIKGTYVERDNEFLFLSTLVFP
ncbi:hypothetical protein HELRODRAFT_80480 [Helobdella robusta]|uniref:Uncharacterized protein n=1 Tax=Helobdella robusta TaxID=6412 RepID=T1G415_HELRO|nr:hypothetical protein HELRODRAFT_80480 [Helobdella robusta]ESO03492.1 hypothetical protein HELRODRAFT_80480 [Helobdella robusta]